MPHRAKIWVTRRKAVSAEMRAAEVCSSDRVTRKSAAMSAEVSAEMAPAAATEMMPASAAAKTVAATAVAAAVTASVATASGERVSRQRQNDGKSRNSKCAPEHGTLPAVTPPTTRREC